MSACICDGYSEDMGGGYYATMLEPNPDCPEHFAKDHPMTTPRIPPSLATERAYRATIAARRAIRSAAMEVDRAAFQVGADVQAAIETMVRAGTLLEQAEAEYAAVSEEAA